MNLLATSIKNFLAGRLQHARLKAPKTGEYAALKFFIGSLPPRGHDDPENFPFVIIRPVGGQDGRDESGLEESQATVSLVCGVYSEDPEAGTTDLTLLTDRIRLELEARQTLDDRYRLQLPLEWQVGDEEENQPHPQYLAKLTTRWVMPGIKQLATPEEEAENYGSGWTGLSQG
ncbi:MAG: hypothetical protein JRJ59_05530 [Deltaproteobacteria bacterium]|nr:hypothetical protein [Deltaproteobacteria bacterium]